MKTTDNLFRKVAAVCAVVCFVVAFSLPTPSYAAYKGKTYHVYLKGDLSYKNRIDIDRAAGKSKRGDKVVIHNETNGGNSIYAQPMIKAIKHMKAKGVYVQSVTKNWTASYGAIFMCYTNSVKVHNNATVLWHVVQSIQGGKNYPVVPGSKGYKWYTKHLYHYSVKVLKKHCKHILPSKYHKEIFQGKDVAISGTTFNKDLKEIRNGK